MKGVRLLHNFEYIHREPQPNGIAHFNIILKELPKEYDYYMICHDDDTLREGAITSIAALAANNPSCVAICSNGYKVKENGKIIGKFVKPEGNRIISSKKEMPEMYIMEKGLPFPAILYKMETTKLPFDVNKGGKYCDTAHTLDLMDFGPVLWGTDNFVLNYTVSEMQDSHDIALSQRRKLLHYINMKLEMKLDSSLVKNFRLNDVYIYYCINHKHFGGRVLRILLYNSCFVLYIKALLKNCWRHITCL